MEFNEERFKEFINMKSDNHQARPLPLKFEDPIPEITLGVKSIDENPKLKVFIIKELSKKYNIGNLTKQRPWIVSKSTKLLEKLKHDKMINTEKRKKSIQQVPRTRNKSRAVPLRTAVTRHVSA